MKHENVSLVLSSGQMPNCLIQCDQYTAFFHRQSEQTGIGNLPVPVNPVLERSSQAEPRCRSGPESVPRMRCVASQYLGSLLHGQSADCRTGYDAQEACLCESADAPVPGAFIVEPSRKSGMVNIAQASSSIVIMVLIIELCVNSFIYMALLLMRFKFTGIDIRIGDGYVFPPQPFPLFSPFFPVFHRSYPATIPSKSNLSPPFSAS